MGVVELLWSSGYSREESRAGPRAKTWGSGASRYQVDNFLIRLLTDIPVSQRIYLSYRASLTSLKPSIVTPSGKPLRARILREREEKDVLCSNCIYGRTVVLSCFVLFCVGFDLGLVLFLLVWSFRMLVWSIYIPMVRSPTASLEFYPDLALLMEFWSLGWFLHPGKQFILLANDP
jgi:hypothetical protein